MDAYLAALRKIDPRSSATRTPTGWSTGAGPVHQHQEWPNDQATVLKFANTRFTSPEHPNGFGDTKAKKINEAVRKHICPTY
ncbi:hypothetical protein NKG94_34535 [Micromonospora sp. M12]